jgi:hypothetical protein
MIKNILCSKVTELIKKKRKKREEIWKYYVFKIINSYKMIANIFKNIWGNRKYSFLIYLKN